MRKRLYTALLLLMVIILSGCGIRSGMDGKKESKGSESEKNTENLLDEDQGDDEDIRREKPEKLSENKDKTKSTKNQKIDKDTKSASETPVEEPQEEILKTGWILEGDNWSYYDENGHKVTGWYGIYDEPNIHYDLFYFDEEGIMQHDTVIDGIVLDSDGMAVEALVGTPEYVEIKEEYYSESGIGDGFCMQVTVSEVDYTDIYFVDVEIYEPEYPSEKNSITVTLTKRSDGTYLAETSTPHYLLSENHDTFLEGTERQQIIVDSPSFHMPWQGSTVALYNVSVTCERYFKSYIKYGETFDCYERGLITRWEDRYPANTPEQSSPGEIYQSDDGLTYAIAYTKDVTQGDGYFYVSNAEYVGGYDPLGQVYYSSGQQLGKTVYIDSDTVITTYHYDFSRRNQICPEEDYETLRYISTHGFPMQVEILLIIDGDHVVEISDSESEI